MGRWFYALAAVLASVGMLAAYHIKSRPELTESSFVLTVEQAAIALGIGIDQVNVSGQRKTHPGDILDVLNLGSVRWMGQLQAKQAQSRIEQLPWIEKATVSRVFPNQLDIRVAERDAFAVWRTGADERLIDRSGHVLNTQRAQTTSGLPIVEGSGAPEETSVLLATIGRFPEIASRLERAERIADRRWTLHLSGGVQIVLPSDREAAALEYLLEQREGAALISRAGTLIDLRARGRLTVEFLPRPPAG